MFGIFGGGSLEKGAKALRDLRAAEVGKRMTVEQADKALDDLTAALPNDKESLDAMKKRILEYKIEK